MFTTVVALRLQLLEVRVMGLTEEIRSQLFGMGALGRRRAINDCDLLMTSTRAVSSRVGGCGGLGPRSKRGLSKEQICIMSGVI